VGNRAGSVRALREAEVAVAEVEETRERRRPACVSSGERDRLGHNWRRGGCSEARQHQRRNGECVGLRVSWKDSSCAAHIQQYSGALHDRNVAYDAEVVRRIRICERDVVLSIHHEACNVEGSKLDPFARIRRIVSRACKMIQSSWNVHDEMTVDEDL